MRLDRRNCVCDFAFCKTVYVPIWVNDRCRRRRGQYVAGEERKEDRVKAQVSVVNVPTKLAPLVADQCSAQRVTQQVLQ
jgi:hypothetical protein